MKYQLFDINTWPRYKKMNNSPIMNHEENWFQNETTVVASFLCGGKVTFYCRIAECSVMGCAVVSLSFCVFFEIEFWTRIRYYCWLGVRTFEKKLSNLAGWNIFWTIFPEDSKNIIVFQNGHTKSTHNFCLACLLSFDEQPSWAELVRRLGVSNVEKKYIFGILMKNCTT